MNEKRAYARDEFPAYVWAIPGQFGGNGTLTTLHLSFERQGEAETADKADAGDLFHHLFIECNRGVRRVLSMLPDRITGELAIAIGVSGATVQVPLHWRSIHIHHGLLEIESVALERELRLHIFARQELAGDEQ